MRTWKIGDGHYNSYQLSFDPDGNLFIVSTNDSVLQKFTPTGQSLGEWPTHHALGVALDATGNIYLSQSNPQDGQAIQKMSADMRTVLATIPMEQAGQLAIGVDGTLYAVQRKEMKIYTFIPTP
jgi:sugar lactone lactonase YvrE